MDPLNISIIGAGRVATAMALELENTGHTINEIYSRNLKNARKLVKSLYKAEVASDLNFSESHSNIFIIAVSDDAIEEVASQIELPATAILAHTSGSRPLSILGYAPTENIGVFYPLQTFSEGKKSDFSRIPILIEAENSFTEKQLYKLGRCLSNRVKAIDARDRLALHVAAVFACNFSNHMFTIASQILKAHKMEFNYLEPLIMETIEKSLDMGPEKGQTGPAIRKDLETLDIHHEFLKDEKIADIYRIISQHILDKY